MNGQIIPSDRNHILNQGSSLRTLKSKPLYYSDIISLFLNYDKTENLIFKVEEVEYRFPSKKIGLHSFSFSEESGKLVGIMGGSGSGKSTFLNVLNGNLNPSKGNIFINQYNVHRDVENLRGIIGYVSQDDILIEELSVYQNLYFNTKLCFKNLSEKQINRKVIDILSMIGLQDVMHLKVGSPMDKTISGGQRKRLNIALELIRKPAVLFVDEPTSGLSSRDSENIMDLLKELALRGNLVFVVIHQPSSEIFKMFDRLLLLDTGGYMIFDGNPLDAVIHFKKCIHHVNADEAECPNCGNVNPEQIFNIIESKVVDEYGNNTKTRKTTPEEWHQKYLDFYQKKEVDSIISLPRSIAKTPSLWVQFVVFFKRDLLSKLSNRQYIIMNLLEAPLLASILAFFVKFYNTKEGESFTYTFSENENIPQYLFISVVVSLFLGLTVTAEEIIKDKKIVKRESFLNLSRNSYLFSKISLIFILSAIQTLSFVLIGNYILEIQGMTWYYWLILFSTACSANLMGLNISSAFNSEKVIYITVPILIIPQLLFSGVIVKFDKLHPFFSKTNEVPFIGEMMISRWAYEALVVTQFKENKYQKEVYRFELQKSKSAWKRDYWLTEMTLRNESLLAKIESKKLTRNALVLKNEIAKEQSNWDNLSCDACISDLEKVSPYSNNYEVYEKINKYLDNVRVQYNSMYEASSDSLDVLAKKMGVENYRTWKSKFENQSLTDLVVNKNELTKIVELDGELIQKADPIYLVNKSKSLRAHFYAPQKRIGNSMLDTLYVNTLVLWFFTIVLFFTLKYDLFRKLLEIKISSKS
jgi:ABC-type multidrug transport system ATPase subunit